jgi:uroporphyrin-III C-methyltransferase
MRGKVYLVGAGPGDPELLTLKAYKALTSADVVLHDDLIGSEILALAPKTAQVRNVGKRCGKKSTHQEEINGLLAQFALLGFKVVRLKGGDPLIFGRAGEEIEALRQAGIEVEVVPGITAALGAAAAAQIPLTHREVSSALVVLTGHHAEKTGTDNWPERLSPKATIVVYMPGYHYAATAHRLIAAGLDKSTPCAVISQATSAQQQIHRTTLEHLPSAPQLSAPTLLVVGEVVRYADHALQKQWAQAAEAQDFYPFSQTEFPADTGTPEPSE